MPVWSYRKWWKDERDNVKNIGRALRRVGIPGREVSAACPMLLRSVIEVTQSVSRAWLACLVIIIPPFIIPYLWIWHSYSTIRPIDYEDLDSILADQTTAIYRIFSPISLTIGAAIVVSVVSSISYLRRPPPDIVEHRLIQPRTTKRSYRFRRITDRFRRITEDIGTALLVLGSGGWAIFMGTEVSKSTLFYAGADVLLLVIFLAMGIYTMRRVVVLTLQWAIPPDVLLIYALFCAFTLTYSGTAREWKSHYRRRRIAFRLRQAAVILEGPMRTGMTDPRCRVADQNLIAIAADFREKIVWISTPKADTRCHLAVVLGQALVVTANGDLDRLIGSVPVPSPFILSWQERVVDAGRWALYAVGPALVVYTGWGFVQDTTIRTLAVQLAVVCFFSNTFFAADQGGGGRLANVIKMGGGLFGWGGSRR